jgi:hypothetical protein
MNLGHRYVVSLDFINLLEKNIFFGFHVVCRHGMMEIWNNGTMGL